MRQIPMVGAGAVLVAGLVGAHPAAAQEPAAKKLVFSGYASASYTYSTNPNGDVIGGRFYGRSHDEFEANALKIVVEMPVATDRLDAGFRVDGLFGQNAQVTKAAGLDLGTSGDLLQAYAVLNVPMKGEGTYVQFKAGKLATLIGMEVMEEVANPNLSIGNQFFFLENFTNTGLRVDVKPSATVDFQVAAFNGWDLVKDNNTKKSFMGRVGITPDAATVIGLVGYVGPEQADDGDDNRYGAELTLSRKLGRATLWLEGDYGREEGATLAGGTAKWWGAGAWLAYDLSPKAALALRGDYVDDKDGARSTAIFTGAQADLRHKFWSATATLNLKPVAGFMLRPEIRYDKSNVDVFDAGASDNQLTFALGTSFVF